jgi:hypothetical protein
MRLKTLHQEGFTEDRYTPGDSLEIRIYGHDVVFFERRLDWTTIVHYYDRSAHARDTNTSLLALQIKEMYTMKTPSSTGSEPIITCAATTNTR